MNQITGRVHPQARRQGSVRSTFGTRGLLKNRQWVPEGAKKPPPATRC